MKRRDFIKAGVAAGQFQLFQNVFLVTFGQLVGGGEARASTGSPFNYLLFLHPGAPPRWTTDGFLASTLPIVDGAETAEVIPHPVVKNVAKSAGNYQTAFGGGTANTTYETTTASYPYKDRTGAIKQIYLPKLWEISLPEWNGTGASFGNFRMSDMLDQTMIIRGYNLLADFGHVKGPALQAQPVASEASVSGLAADKAASATMIPAIALTDGPGRPLGYRSNGAGLTLGAAGSSSNIASDILQSFMRNGIGSGHMSNRQVMNAAVDAALERYRVESQKLDPRSNNLYTNLKNVNLLVEKLKTLDLGAQYASVRNKYAALIRYCTSSYAGLVGDLKQTINGSGVITAAPYMADNYSDKFALAELFINNGISASFTFVSGGQAVPGSYVGSSNNPQGVQNDEHEVTDRMLSLFAHNWKYRAWMSCVNEFSKAIGPEKWARTVVQNGAEYNRSPNKGSGGSDHAINACVTSVVSGAISSFLPIGNIARTANSDPNHSNYGTYGVGAATNIEGVGSVRLANEYVANTLMTLMGIESPFRDKTTLIKSVNGQWLPKTEDPKNV